MSWIDRLENKFGKHAPEHITEVLLGGQILSYLLVYTRPEYSSYFYLTGRQLLDGQIWRLGTILFAPIAQSLLFVALAWYFFYMLGTALERQWGSFRYLLYIAISYLALIIFSLVFQDAPISNSYLFTSLFLAFAHLYPNFQLLLFFILPVKIKWLGYLAWFGIIVSILFATIPVKVMTLLSVSNYFLFFWSDLKYSSSSIFKGMSKGPQKVLHTQKPFHICAVCGHNEIDNPDMEIRYCSQCVPTTCYCGVHSQNHQHKRVIN